MVSFKNFFSTILQGSRCTGQEFRAGLESCLVTQVGEKDEDRELQHNRKAAV